MALTKIPSELSSTTGIVDNSNATAITIDSNENVGIGTSSPDTLVQATNTSASTNYISYEIGSSGVGSANKGGFAIYELGGLTTSITYARDGTGHTDFNADTLVFNNAANTSERMRIDSSGRVTTPSQPSFHVRGNTSGWWGFSTPGVYYPVNSSTVSAQTTSGNFVGFNVVASGLGCHNTGNHYNLSNATFTAPVAGRYLFYGQALSRRDGTTNTHYPTMGFLLNGTFTQSGWDQLFYLHTTSSGAEAILKCNQTIYMNANDTLQVYLGSVGSSIKWYSDRFAFGGHLLG